MDELDDRKLFFRSYKIIKIYQCNNCKVWVTKREKICPNCDVSLKSDNLVSADLVKERIRSILQVDH